MEQLIRKILLESEYVENNNNISYFHRNNAAYFFTIRFSQENLQNIKSKDLLQENEAYNSLLTEFNKIVKEGSDIAIEKNSSLIILVECEDINALSNLQQQILLIEEDEYFFKKYVLLYTRESITNLHVSTPIIPHLITKLHNNSQFDLFAQQGANNEISEYIIVLQLFIKLPFLKLDFENQDFKTLDQKIIESLGGDSELFISLIDKLEVIERLDFTQSDAEEGITNLISSLPND